MQDAALEAACDDNRTRKATLRDVPDELDPVHPRHVNFADDDIGRRSAELLERIDAVTGLGDGSDAEAPEQCYRRPALEVMVVDDERRQ
jgi:hypothetical protein